MKIQFITIVLGVMLFTLGGCFKNEPKRAMMRAAGAWNMEKAEIQLFDSLGNLLEKKEVEGLGTLMLNHFDDFLFEGSNSIQVNQNFVDWGTDISTTLLANRTWWLTVDAEQFAIGSMDPETGYVTTIRQYTVSKLNNRKFEFFNVILYPNSQVQSIEKWYLKRR